jgi:phosphoenolpyruvate carboxykinase (GTP)
MKDQVIMKTASKPTSTKSSSTAAATPSKGNECVRQWVDQNVAMCQPDKVVWCDGSAAERKSMIELGVKDGTFIKLNQHKLPNSYLHRSNPNDVARSEQLTFICTPSDDLCGPTNNWMETRAA